MRRLGALLLATVCAVAALSVPQAAVAATGDVTIDGRGYGHGRGMGQYGSLGYAVDHGWSSARILDHFYGGTRAGSVGNVPMSVELLSLRDRPLLVTGAGLTVNGSAVGAPAVQVVRSGPTQFTVLKGAGCGGPWTAGPVLGADVTVASSASVEVCDLGFTRGYRGNLRMVLRSAGTAVVNQLLVEDYLRGVVPRESPASWASAGGGRGAQALQAQSVAARSYALASPFASYATTCDTTTCQVYGGSYRRSQTTGVVTSLEDPRTDSAIAATRGVVRFTTKGTIARTEFSSSTGGWSAGGGFPGVQDLGDATAANPNRAWSVTFDRATLSSRLGVGALSGLQVTRRSGTGADGGRVLEVVATTSNGKVTLTGAAVRSRLGLKSDWFSIGSFDDTAASAAMVRAVWTDMLGREPSPEELRARTGQLAAGTPVSALAGEVSRSTEHAQLVVAAVYRSALGRSPSTTEMRGWVAQYRSGGSVPQVQAGILASEEAWLVSGGQSGAWVDRMYRVTLGRGAGPAERTYWAQRLSSSGRYSVSLGIGGSVEAAQVRLEGYYARLLGRASDPGSRTWIPYLVGSANGDVVVPAAVIASPEYAARARSRF